MSEPEFSRIFPPCTSLHSISLFCSVFSLSRSYFVKAKKKSDLFVLVPVFKGWLRSNANLESWKGCFLFLPPPPRLASFLFSGWQCSESSFIFLCYLQCHLDINECESSQKNPCPTSEMCVNTPGGFSCACEGSLTLSPDGSTCIGRSAIQGEVWKWWAEG